MLQHSPVHSSSLLDILACHYWQRSSFCLTEPFGLVFCFFFHTPFYSSYVVSVSPQPKALRDLNLWIFQSVISALITIHYSLKKWTEHEYILQRSQRCTVGFVIRVYSLPHIVIMTTLNRYTIIKYGWHPVLKLCPALVQCYEINNNETRISTFKTPLQNKSPQVKADPWTHAATRRNVDHSSCLAKNPNWDSPKYFLKVRHKLYLSGLTC